MCVYCLLLNSTIYMPGDTRRQRLQLPQVATSFTALGAVLPWNTWSLVLRTRGGLSVSSTFGTPLISSFSWEVSEHRTHGQFSLWICSQPRYQLSYWLLFAVLCSTRFPNCPSLWFDCCDVLMYRVFVNTTSTSFKKCV